MRDRTASRSYSPEAEEFRRIHEKRRAWGLQRRHAEKLRRAREQLRDPGPAMETSEGRPARPITPAKPIPPLPAATHSPRANTLSTPGKTTPEPTKIPRSLPSPAPDAETARKCRSTLDEVDGQKRMETEPGTERSDAGPSAGGPGTPSRPPSRQADRADDARADQTDQREQGRIRARTTPDQQPSAGRRGKSAGVDRPGQPGRSTRPGQPGTTRRPDQRGEPNRATRAKPDRAEMDSPGLGRAGPGQARPGGADLGARTRAPPPRSARPSGEA